jgi:hypothetical protein
MNPQTLTSVTLAPSAIFWFSAVAMSAFFVAAIGATMLMLKRSSTCASRVPRTAAPKARTARGVTLDHPKNEARFSGCPERARSSRRLAGLRTAYPH